MLALINHPRDATSRRRIRALGRALSGTSAVALLAFLVLFGGCSTAEVVPQPVRVEVTPFRLVPDHERFLVPGESLEYAVTVLFMKVGILKYRTRSAEDAGADLLAIDSMSAPTGIAASLSRYGGRSTSWIDRTRVRMMRYVFAATTTDPPKRRYNELLPDEGRLAGAEVWGSSWVHRSFAASWALDPSSLQFLVRVIDLEEDETVRLDMFEGHNRRLATIRGNGREELTVKGEKIPARVMAVRVDRVAGGELIEDEPEMDVRMWISEDDRRVILQSRGRVSGVSATIKLVRRTVAPPRDVEVGGESAAPLAPSSRSDPGSQSRSG